jgi:iduronate 2-sulfatase
MRGVLHIIVDDLRPELGAYGLTGRATPNIDSLATTGVTFDRAYAQIAVCGPSRNSFMTGRRPDRSRSWNFINSFREDHPDWTTLPGLFLKAGGVALGVGKVFHPMLPPAYDGPSSWSSSALPYFNPCWNTADLPQAVHACAGKAQSAKCDGGLPCVPCPIDIQNGFDKWRSGHGNNVSVANEFCEIDAVEDIRTVEHAIAHLRGEAVAAAVAAGLPWYLGVGMHKPHMPWQAAPHDWSQHPLESIEQPTHQQPPIRMPALAYHFSDPVDGHIDPWTPLPPHDVRAARRAYRAATTGMDRKLGALLTELDVLRLTASTAVVLHGDHGWHLGEGGAWQKFTNFEAATRVPLIIRAPWLISAPQDTSRVLSGGAIWTDGGTSSTDGTGGAGLVAPRAASLVELVDVLPTIAALAGVALPANETFDGASMVPLLKAALGGGTSLAAAGWIDKAAAFSQYPRRVTDPLRPWYDNSIIHNNRSTFTHMGYTARAVGWRYVEWVAWNSTTLAPEWDHVAARELYDHRLEPSFPTDFDAGELVNLADEPEYNTTVANLSRLVREQFGAVREVEFL